MALYFDKQMTPDLEEYDAIAYYPEYHHCFQFQ